jgi:hypothetical protein
MFKANERFVELTDADQWFASKFFENVSTREKLRSTMKTSMFSNPQTFDALHG